MENYPEKRNFSEKRNKKLAKMVKEFNKSLSNTSTTSIESGIFDMYDSESGSLTSDQITNVGETIEYMLIEAQKTDRLICGLKEAAKYLTETEIPENSLFFFVAPSKVGDYEAHMSSIFLQAFCFERDIYIIQLDSAQKLSRILGLKECHTCALVQRTIPISEEHEDIIQEEFTDIENELIDHCESFWSEPIQPIIKLPEK